MFCLKPPSRANSLYCLARSKRNDPSHPPRIGAAIGTYHVVGGYWKGQQSATFLAGYSLTADIDCEATGFTYNLPCIGESLNLASTGTTMTFFRLLWLDLIIFGCQPV